MGDTACGCDYCAVEEYRQYGHAEQIATHPTESTLLLRCPKCGSLYEMHSWRGSTRRLTPAEAAERFPGAPS